MARQDQNEAFLLTSFLYGGNADYIEALYARYTADPKSVDPSWQEFFANLSDNAEAVKQSAEGPSWARRDWPRAANGELVSALDGNWGDVAVKAQKAVTEKAKSDGHSVSPEAVMQATRDSIHAIMMIRAYRMRGHLHANLDPLGLENREEAPELDPANYGFTEADFDRQIFIDNYLGLEFATVPQMLEILKRTYCGTLGIEFMHISDPEAKAWIQERIEGPDKEISFTPKASAPSWQSLPRPKGSKSSSTSNIPAPSASGSMAGSRSFRRLNRSSSAAARWGSRTSFWACRIAAASTFSPR
jgi:2-oxoglutarate dehydrogenase E1 component